MNQVRPLTSSDQLEVERLIATRLPLVGASWTPESITKELESRTSSLGIFNVNTLEALVLYKEMGPTLEILFIVSRKGAPQSGFLMLDALIAAHSHAREVWLEVHEDNQTAIDFYERHGFARVSARAGYYPNGKQAINYNLVIARTPG